MADRPTADCSFSNPDTTSQELSMIEAQRGVEDIMAQLARVALAIRKSQVQHHDSSTPTEAFVQKIMKNLDCIWSSWSCMDKLISKRQAVRRDQRTTRGVGPF